MSKRFFFCEKLFFGFFMSRIRYAAVYWTNSGALRFIMKSFALRALIWNNIEKFIRVEAFSTGRSGIAIAVCISFKFPFSSAFVNGCIWC